MRVLSFYLLAGTAFFTVAAAPDGTVPATAVVLPQATIQASPPAPAANAAAAITPATAAVADAKAPAAPAKPAGTTVKAGVEAYRRGAYSQAAAIWRPLAEKGDPDAQFNLAQAYRLGRGVGGVDLKQAEDLYARAAAHGHEEAQGKLGIILFQRGERTRSMPYLIKGAQIGDPVAQYIYGTALFNGDLIEKDWPRAYALMTRAANAGLPQAAESLKKMDGYLPTAQRQQGISMAASGSYLKPGSAAGKTVLASRTPLAARPATAKPAPAAAPKPVPATPPRQAIAAKPAPAPQPVQMARAAAIAPGQGWYVQLGAYSSRDAAVAAWHAVRGRIGALAGLRGSLSQAGKMTRLRSGPVNGMAAAARICAAASRVGQACFPAAP